MKVKTIIMGYLFGVVLTWLLYLVLIPACGTGRFMRDVVVVFRHSEEILRQSLIAGIFSAVVFSVIAIISQKAREKRELENEMKEFFRRQNEKV